MKRKPPVHAWTKTFKRSVVAMTGLATASGARVLTKVLQPAAARRRASPGTGTWQSGVAMSATGARRFRLYRPPGVGIGEQLPLMVMLHGCGQDASSFAASTGMNRVAARERFLVLYPEQEKMANPKGCWNWYDTGNGRAHKEAALVMAAIDQVCLWQPVDRARVAITGLSAGAGMAALLVTLHPERFKALVMHSGIPPGTAHSALSALHAMRGLRATVPLAATPGAMQAHWPSLLVIHGDADTVVSPHNGQQAAQVWAQAAGARAGATRSIQRGKRYPMTVTDFTHQGSLVATLVAVDGLAHAWSGGAAGQAFSDRQGPDASRMAWAFASRQFRARAHGLAHTAQGVRAG